LPSALQTDRGMLPSIYNTYENEKSNDRGTQSQLASEISSSKFESPRE